MFTIVLNDGRVYKDVVSFEILPLHGFRSINKAVSGSITYEGFIHGEYFKIESVRDYGVTSWELIQGEYSEEEEENLIEWIENGSNHDEDKVFKRYIKSVQ